MDADVPPDPDIWALWAKSDAGGRPHSLPGHLLDTAAVAELIWDEFAAPAFTRRVDAVTGGRGRDTLRLVAGWHDVGKATPGFQAKSPELMRVAAAGGWVMPRAAGPTQRENVKHGQSGHVVLKGLVSKHGLAWLLPLVAGHHGSFAGPPGTDLRYRTEWQRGPRSDPWTEWQERLAMWVVASLDVDLAELDEVRGRPSITDQLALAGFVSMADWIASSTLFPGMGREPMVLADARERATRAWATLGLGRGWRIAGEALSFEERFGKKPRPLQALVAEAATGLDGAGLLVVEAPMGEGKTEAALVAAEILARRGGFDGLLFAMPTQGTTDAMYERCRTWAADLDPEVSLTLLHGKAMANETWRDAVEGVRVTNICDPELDEYGLPVEDLGSGATDLAESPTAWLLGRHRGLLSHVAMATVDQPLVAATEIKYVALRYAGLSGKVVVIDEVHSYDVFMSQYLHQFLRACRDLQVPVILMSATLPPSQRAEFVAAYMGGLEREAVDLDCAAQPAGYPRVTAWAPGHGLRTTICDPWRDDLSVSVSWADETDPEAGDEVVDLLDCESAEGGVVLMIANTVKRAQAIYSGLAAKGVPAVVLHGRLTTSARAQRTADLVSRLGVASRERPERLVVVATQIAEQSFDVDADLLVTDIAPMDLLLQRIGRLHRHARDSRPPAMADPRVVVTGVDRRSAVPRFVEAFTYVYEEYSLLRAAQAIGDGVTWAVPSQVPELVAAAYDDSAHWSPAWAATGAAAFDEAQEARRKRSAEARAGVLAILDAKSRPDLRGLHPRGVAKGAVTVRDGEPTREICLVWRERETGRYRTLHGRPLGVSGERAVDDTIAREVLGDSVRVRHSDDYGDLAPLPGWLGTPLLRGMSALVLNEDLCANGEWGSARYDLEIGLVAELVRRPTRTPAKAGTT